MVCELCACLAAELHRPQSSYSGIVSVVSMPRATEMAPPKMESPALGGPPDSWVAMQDGAESAVMDWQRAGRASQCLPSQVEKNRLRSQVEPC